MTTDPDYLEGFPSMSDNVWVADHEFDLGQVSSLFGVANKSLRSIFGVYDEFVLKEDDLLNFEDFESEDFVGDSVGVIVYMSIWVAIAVLFTIAGIIWCVCNKCICCCKSSFTGGGKNIDELESSDPHYQLRPYYSERNDGEKKLKVGAIIIAVLMAVWLLGLLTILVHVFAANEKLNESIDNITGDLDNIKEDIDSYLDTTRAQLQHSFKSAYKKLSARVLEIWADCPECNGLRESKIVESLKNNIDTLVGTLSVASKAYDTKDLKVLKKTLNELYQTNPRERLEEVLQTTGDELTKNVDDLDKSLEEVQSEMDGARGDIEEDFEVHLKDANTGLYWGIMLFNILYCLIFFLILIGTVLATFARQKGLKLAGYLLYRVAIVLMFVLCIFVVIQVLVAVAAAGIVSEIFCPAIRRLENGESATTSRMVDDVGNARQATGDYEIPNPGQILRNCKADFSAYNVFDLQQTYDVEQIRGISDNFENILGIRHKQIIESQTKNNEFIDDLGSELYSIESRFKNSEDNFTALIADIRGQIRLLPDTEPVQPPFPVGTRALENRQDPIEATRREIVRQVGLYEDFVISTVTTRTGKCAPAYNAINSTISIFCYKVPAPIASYWFILQFVPVIFIVMVITALFFERVDF
ncbi:unnamed protein product [Orchesella dallaii]|uniref:Prominin-1-A n=1 Tax=Orchesella dallaii TaxID=48710 RepID=A0ABP1Q7Q1_9HEXA